MKPLWGSVLPAMIRGWACEERGPHPERGRPGRDLCPTGHAHFPAGPAPGSQRVEIPGDPIRSGQLGAQHAERVAAAGRRSVLSGGEAGVVRREGQPSVG